MDANRAVSARLDPAPGSFRGPIEHIATDNQGGLWLARRNGIARLQIDSRFATQGEFHGARAFLRHGERLYASYHGGVGWRDKPTGQLNPVAGLPNSPSSLFSVGDRVFGTGQFLREITRENRAVVALGLSFNSVTPLRSAPGKFVGASITGLRLLHFDGGAWRDEGLLPGVRGGVRHALEDREGWLWVQGYDGSGSWRVDFREGASLDAPVEYFDAGRGLPFSRRLDPERFFSLGGETLTTRAGMLLRYDRAAGRLVAENRIENAPVLGPVATAPGVDGDQWWFINMPTPQLVQVVPTGENRWRAEPLSAAGACHRAAVVAHVVVHRHGQCGGTGGRRGRESLAGDSRAQASRATARSPVSRGARATAARAGSSRRGGLGAGPGDPVRRRGRARDGGAGKTARFARTGAQLGAGTGAARARDRLGGESAARHAGERDRALWQLHRRDAAGGGHRLCPRPAGAEKNPTDRARVRGAAQPVPGGEGGGAQLREIFGGEDGGVPAGDFRR